MLSKIKVICALEADNAMAYPRSRRYSIHPYNRERDRKDEFINFYDEIRK